MSRDETFDFDDLARRAADGDQQARSDLLRGLQDPMYRLALRFLGQPHDAQDATQEVLVRIMTQASFEGAVQVHDLGLHGRHQESSSYSETDRRVIGAVPGGVRRVSRCRSRSYGPDPGGGGIPAVVRGTRISSTYGMLLCIPRPQRAATSSPMSWV